MNLTQAVAGGIFYEAPDGRIVFRPWGKFGPCYLLTPAQRAVRARLQLAYFGAMIIAVTYGATRLGPGGLFLKVLPITMAGNYLLFWLFSLGLPRTEPPPSPSKEYRQELRRRHNRAFGKPFLWVMLVLSVLMAAAGLLAGIATGQWIVAALAVGFFGLSAGVFGWQLRNQ